MALGLGRHAKRILKIFRREQRRAHTRARHLLSEARRDAENKKKEILVAAQEKALAFEARTGGAVCTSSGA